MLLVDRYRPRAHTDPGSRPTINPSLFDCSGTPHSRLLSAVFQDAASVFFSTRDSFLSDSELRLLSRIRSLYSGLADG